MTSPQHHQRYVPAQLLQHLQPLALSAESPPLCSHPAQDVVMAVILIIYNSGFKTTIDALSPTATVAVLSKSTRFRTSQALKCLEYAL
eukprot:m.130256 g.130256  ORF g.130256 m.130256 type:complete len:88 (-) comp15870_c1_seq17:160-423(-)